MVNGSPVPGIIAAAVVAARRRVKRHFREAEAFSAERAVAYEPKRRMERKYVEGLVAHGALIEAPGGYYLDEERLADHDRRRRKRGLAVVGVSLAVAAALAAALR